MTVPNTLRGLILHKIEASPLRDVLLAVADRVEPPAAVLSPPVVIEAAAEPEASAPIVDAELVTEESTDVE